MKQEQDLYNSIFRFFDAQQDEFLGYLKDAGDSMDPEAIHQFRLNLKRIKALCMLTEYATDGRFLTSPNFKAFRKIFKPAGRLRDVHVQLELIEAREDELQRSFPMVRKGLLEIGEKPMPRLKKRIHKFSPEAFERLRATLNEAMAQVPEDLFLQQAIKWVDTGPQQLTPLARQEHAPEVLHQLRARLKELFYMIDMLNIYAHTDIVISGSVSYLKDLARCIGAWHDQHILIGRLNFFLDNCPDKRRKICKESTYLLNKLPQRNEALFRELHDALSESGLFRMTS